MNILKRSVVFVTTTVVAFAKSFADLAYTKWVRPILDHLIVVSVTSPTTQRQRKMGLTSDRNDPDLGHGVNEEPVPMNKKYLVLSPEELAKGYVEPIRDTYTHLNCQRNTTMGPAIAATYARNPKFYGATYCVTCSMHRPLTEFVWRDTDQFVGETTEEYNERTGI